MKIGSWLILALTCAGFAVTPAKAITPDMWQNDLARAQAFVVGPWEIFIPPLFFGRNANERELRFLLKEPDAAARMRWLINHGTPEAQMYGLYGLRLLRDPEFEQFASRLGEEPGEILTTTVAVGFHKSRQEVVERIRENNFRRM
jgi:hypothetical protein